MFQNQHKTLYIYVRGSTANVGITRNAQAVREMPKQLGRTENLCKLTKQALRVMPNQKLGRTDNIKLICDKGIIATSLFYNMNSPLTKVFNPRARISVNLLKLNYKKQLRDCTYCDWVEQKGIQKNCKKRNTV